MQLNIAEASGTSLPERLENSSGQNKIRHQLRLWPLLATDHLRCCLCHLITIALEGQLHAAFTINLLHMQPTQLHENAGGISFNHAVSHVADANYPLINNIICLS